MPAEGKFWEIPVLFEDAHLLVLNKPADLAVVSEAGEPAGHPLMDLLHAGIAAGKPWAREPGRAWLKQAHRPDDAASGVLILAKHKETLATLLDWFGASKPGRRYLALVQGNPPGDQFEMDAPIGIHPTRPGVMRTDLQQGKKAHTLARVRERFSGWTLIECDPLTDRRHQVRVHLRLAGFTVTGDSTYSGRPLFLSRLKSDYRLAEGREERPLIARPALHLEGISLPHPVTGQELTVAAPWPKDLEVAVKYLRRYAGGTTGAVQE